MNRYSYTFVPWNGKITRGDVFYVTKSPSEYAVGQEEYAARPGVVISNDKLGNRNVVVVVYLTTSPKFDSKTHVKISSLDKKSIALCEQIFTVSKSRLGDKYGHLTPQEMSDIDTAVGFALGLGEARPVISVEELPYKDDAKFYKRAYEDLLSKMAGTR